MSVISWEAPEPAANASGRGWSGGVLSELLAHPNDWALIWEEQGSTPKDRGRARNRGMNFRTSAARQGERVEVTYRFDATAGISRVYARYTPGEK